MVAVSNALNAVYEVRETRPWWHARLVALALMLVLLVLLVTSLVLITYGGEIAATFAARFGLGHVFPVSGTSSNGC
jgi:membrane protein